MLVAKRFVFSMAVIALSGCGKFSKAKVEKPDPTNEQFLSLSNIQNAPASIKEAGKAVVMVVTHEDGRGGSGALITKDGLLMTNNHVLGSTECSKSGCYVRLVWNLQVGEKSEYKNVFAVPKVVAPDLDVAILQVFNLDSKTGTPTDKLKVNDYLDFSRETPESLIGKAVFALGHPKLGLKKWSTGEAYEAQGNWFLSNEFTLPGSSGSPILNGDGKIVGIHHRGGRGHEDVTQYGIRNESIGTASAPIMDLIAKIEKDDAPGLALLTNVDQAVSKEKFLSNSTMFLRAHRFEIGMEAVPADGAANLARAKVHPSFILADYMDSELASTTAAESADDLYKFTAMAGDSIYWLDCKVRSAENSYKMCPSEEEQKKWFDRLGKVFRKVRSITGERDYFWLADSAYVLGKDERSGNEAAIKAIEDNADGRLDFNTASYLSVYTDKAPPKVGNIDIREYLLNFNSVPYHEHHFRAIVNGLGQLYAHELISKEDLQSRLNSIIGDTKITLGERIRAERIAYRYGLLK